MVAERSKVSSSKERAKDGVRNTRLMPKERAVSLKGSVRCVSKRTHTQPPAIRVSSVSAMLASKVYDAHCQDLDHPSRLND